MADSPADIRRGRLKLVLLFLLFFVPTVAALLLVQSGWRPAGTVNHGKLVEPVEPVLETGLIDRQGQAVTAEDFFGHWTILVSSAGSCGQICLDTLNLLGRAHIALNKDMDRVRLVVVQTPSARPPELPDSVQLLQAQPELLEGWSEEAEMSDPAVHIVDYRGLRMLTYPTPLDGSGLLKDLRRLLRLSDEEAERRAAKEAR